MARVYKDPDDRLAQPSTSRTLTVRQWREKLEAFGHRCAYCGRADQKLIIEHVEARMRGGEDVPENIVPACMACNCRKRHALLLEWVWHENGLIRVQPTAGRMRVTRDGERVIHPAVHLEGVDWSGRSWYEERAS